MKIIFIFLILINALPIPSTYAYEERDIFWNEYSNKSESLYDINGFRNKLRQEFKNNLLKLSANIKQEIIQRADHETKASWPSLLASDQLEYIRSGDRMTYQGYLSNRRQKLMRLIMAEILTEDQKYLNQIANGVWLMLEESSWVYPAHLYLQKAGLGLPDPSQIVIDLGAGQSTGYIAWANLFVGEKLMKISPMISKRIDYEVNRRIVRPFLDTNMPWMGFDGHEFWKWNIGNNWNIWINSNILMTGLLTVNQTERNSVIKRSILSADKFVNSYPKDGADNEGPHYWGYAAGRMIQFISLLSTASGNQMKWSSNELLRRAGEYIYKIHIDGQYFFNFADSSPKEIPDPWAVLEYGKIFNDQKMKEFASYLYRLSDTKQWISSHLQSGELNQIFMQISANDLFPNITPRAPQPIESWFPGIEVIALRTEEGTAKGIFLGAKAGNNDETQHNHNDIGNFVIYVDGMPAIIDVGVGTYVRKTFSKDRYSLWNLQSQWHNTPTINGVQQEAGPQFRAKNSKYTKLRNGGQFESDIAGAYPKEAQVKSWVRRITFDRNANTVNLTETYKLIQSVEPFKIHFITVSNISFPTNGTVILENKNTTLYMQIDSKAFSVELDQYAPGDAHIADVWDHLPIKRLSLVPKHKTLEGQFSVLFHLK